MTKPSPPREIAKQGLDELLRRLQDPDLNERLRAVGELEQAGIQALPVLLDTMLARTRSCKGPPSSPSYAWEPKIGPGSSAPTTTNGGA